MDAISQSGSVIASTAQPAQRPNSSDYETFLLMLTTQLENQDPTDPADADELAVQLATFSGVEQQTLTNDLLADLVRQTASKNLAEMGNWVGMEVLAPGPVTFDGAPIELELSVPPLADQAELVVSTEDGIELQRLPLDPSARSVTWAGIATGGEPLRSGRFQFEVSSQTSGQPLSGGEVRAYREVAEVRSDGGTVILMSIKGDRIDADSISGVRAP